jgi:hypothetical protein
VGRPQFAAAGLLFLYVLQCLWLIHLQSRQGFSDTNQALRIYYGLAQWRVGTIAGTPESFEGGAANRLPSPEQVEGIRIRDGFDLDRSPLNYLVAATPFLVWPERWPLSVAMGNLPAVLPNLFFGVMLGGSLWYVSRRLYGNTGGYIALALYCFSPAMIANVADSTPRAEIGAVWGAFGAVFTAIAVAHTLYAPREVVLWNWRRILLLGLSLALAIGNQFSLAAMALLVLSFMLWVAPVRTRAAFAIWGAACVCAFVMLFASYFFHPALFFNGLAHARWIEIQPRALTMSLSYRYVIGGVFRGSPALMLALPAAFITFFSWRRARYFGNAAPLLVAGFLILLAINAPQVVANTCLVAALTFFFVFTAGVLADLLETRYGVFVMAAVVGLLIASAVWNVLQLAVGT